MSTLQLQEIERALAPLVGPFYDVDAAAGSTTSTVKITDFQSTVDVGGLENLYILRRGYKRDGTAVSPFDTGDRVRRIKQVTLNTGEFQADRAWTNAPVAGERIELHHLHPDWQLRRIVQNALFRCYRVEEVRVTLSGVAVDRDLTALVPWITEPEQVYDVHWNYQNSIYAPIQAPYWETFVKDGNVWLRMRPDPYPNLLIITARRPIATWVDTGSGFANSTTGPTADTHRVIAPLDYVLARALVEAWRLARPAMVAASAEGFAPDEKQAALRLTAAIRQYFRPPRRRVMIAPYFGLPVTRI